MSFIEDGTGTGSRARVDNENSLKVRAIASTEFTHLTAKGRAFYLESGVIDLTSASSSAVLYIKNTGSAKIIITETILNSSKSKELSGTPNTQGTILMELIVNPTATSTTVDVTPVPMKSSNAISLEATVHKGAEGETFTGGLVAANYLFQHGTQSKGSASPSAFYLSKDDILGVRLTPPQEQVRQTTKYK